MTELKRELGLVGATNIGIGNIIGAGIFVLSGMAAGLAGPGVVLSFVIAGFITLLTALSCAELSSFITDTGGPINYAKKAFGTFWGYLVGWMSIFDYVVGAAAVSIGFGAYLLLLLAVPVNTILIVAIATALPLALLVLNSRGIKEAAGLNSVMVLVKIIGLLVFIVVGAACILSSGDFSNYAPMFPNGLSGIFSGTAIVFFAFIGFNTITTVSEEVKDPGRTIPRAILLSVTISTLLYVAVAAVEVGLVRWDILGGSPAPLEVALGAATSSALLVDLIAFSAMLAISSVVMSSLMGSSRSLLAMARQKTLPSALSRISKNGVPKVTVITSGVAIASIVLMTGGNIEWLASAFNFGTLLTFIVINLSLIRLRTTMPDHPRSFRVPLCPYVPALAIVFSIILIGFLNLNAVLITSAWIALGLAIYVFYQRRLGAVQESEAVEFLAAEVMEA